PRHSTDSSHESIPLPGDCLDVLLPIDSFAKRPAKRGDVMVQVVLLHNCIGPDGLDKFIFPQQMSAASDQYAECFKNLGPQTHRLPFPQEQPFASVEAKNAELIDAVDLLRHCPSRKIPGILQ